MIWLYCRYCVGRVQRRKLPCRLFMAWKYFCGHNILLRRPILKFHNSYPTWSSASFMSILHKRAICNLAHGAIGIGTITVADSAAWLRHASTGPRPCLSHYSILLSHHSQACASCRDPNIPSRLRSVGHQAHSVSQFTQASVAYPTTVLLIEPTVVLLYHSCAVGVLLPQRRATQARRGFTFGALGRNSSISTICLIVQHLCISYNSINGVLPSTQIRRVTKTPIIRVRAKHLYTQRTDSADGKNHLSCAGSGLERVRFW